MLVSNLKDLYLSCILQNINILYRKDSKSCNLEEFYKSFDSFLSSDVINAICSNDVNDDAILNNKLKFLLSTADAITSKIAGFNPKNSNCNLIKSHHLESIFNKLHLNNGNKFFEYTILHSFDEINFAKDTSDLLVAEAFEKELQAKLQKIIHQIDDNKTFYNTTLDYLENYLTYVPAILSTDIKTNISWFDYLKIKTAIAYCLNQSLDEKTILEWTQNSYQNKASLWDKELFLFFSIDLSGIQNFIYTIASKGALKTLRSRSFYLEIMMEHIIDELLTKFSLTRANVIYSGGCHCYLLLPHNDNVISTLKAFETELNQWFINNFDISLFAAIAYVKTSANDLFNVDGKYIKIYKEISSELSYKKATRYSASEIQLLNNLKTDDLRECRICRHSGRLNSNDECEICEALLHMSSNIINNDFFAVFKNDPQIKSSLKLPFNACLLSCDDNLILKLQEKQLLKRVYTKNNNVLKDFETYKVWIGSYKEKDLSLYADSALGIKRIGILRADVDNLGATFANGFKNKENKIDTNIFKTAVLSRHLSLFFKFYINNIFANPTAHIFTNENSIRNVNIVYSGGDDVFFIGSWNDVIDSYMDLKNTFDKYSDNSLTLSGGIGIYQEGTPLSIMALETENLVEASKALDGKNAICCFTEKLALPWKAFINEVLEKRYKLIAAFFDSFIKNDESSLNYGMSFLYHLLELIRNSSETINKARVAYLLSRMEPSENSENYLLYKDFAQKIYYWYQNKEQIHYLILAIYLYIYKVRGNNV